MKVYIGPYKNHVNTLKLEEFLEEKLNVSEVVADKIGSFIQPVLNALWNRWGKEQKVKIKIHPYDAWSVDSTLSPIIHPLLVELRRQLHGAPITDPKDAPKELRPTKEEKAKLKEEWDVDEKHFDRWHWILDEMIFAFGALSTDWESKFYSGESDIIWVPADEDGFTEMKTGPNHTYSRDDKAYEKEYERIQNGLRLFGKYYLNLWD